MEIPVAKLGGWRNQSSGEYRRLETQGEENWFCEMLLLFSEDVSILSTSVLIRQFAGDNFLRWNLMEKRTLWSSGNTNEGADYFHIHPLGYSHGSQSDRWIQFTLCPFGMDQQNRLNPVVKSYDTFDHCESDGKFGDTFFRRVPCRLCRLGCSPCSFLRLQRLYIPSIICWNLGIQACFQHIRLRDHQLP